MKKETFVRVQFSLPSGCVTNQIIIHLIFLSFKYFNLFVNFYCELNKRIHVVHTFSHWRSTWQQLITFKNLWLLMIGSCCHLYTTEYCTKIHLTWKGCSTDPPFCWHHIIGIFCCIAFSFNILLLLYNGFLPAKQKCFIWKERHCS